MDTVRGVHIRVRIPRKTSNDRECHRISVCFNEPAVHAAAYTDFVSALANTAKAQKRITAKDKPVSNQKYAFRCFLLKLGFIGDDFKRDRKILLERLSGSSAFKGGADDEISK